VKTWMSVAIVAAGLGIGCAQQPKATQQQTAAASPVLDVQPVTASSPAPVYAPPVAPAQAAPAAADPVAAQPAPATTQTPAAPAAGGQNYTVKKGDTLYHIAKEKYGDGKQWQKIASANPGVTPSSLRVGQTLVVP